MHARRHAGVSDRAYRQPVDPERIMVRARVRARLAAELDYDNFKNEVRRHQGQAGTAKQDALHDVWSVMHRLQE